MVIQRLLAPTLRLVALVGVLGVLPLVSAAAQSTPEASPQASPSASPIAVGNGCDALGTYFQQLADLTLENEGLVIMREAGFDALALSADEATTVVVSLEDLIPELEGMAPPEPARLYHNAYLEMMAWYRDLATYRDEASHQRLINNDRRLFSIMGQAIQSGQAACGYAAWNDARDAAFPPGS
ncbi:MAG: hypothetical protein M3457_22985 [Chloroflexota bacterium]|nr:hypothetical protein [Chloroflexota bacterium]